MLLDRYGWDQQELARRTSVSPSHITKRLALLGLPKAIKHAINQGQISVIQGLHLKERNLAPNTLDALDALVDQAQGNIPTLDGLIMRAENTTRQPPPPGTQQATSANVGQALLGHNPEPPISGSTHTPPPTRWEHLVATAKATLPDSPLTLAVLAGCEIKRDCWLLAHRIAAQAGLTTARNVPRWREQLATANKRQQAKASQLLGLAAMELDARKDPRSTLASKYLHLLQTHGGYQTKDTRGNQ
jgi:hypothetical protein